MAFPAAWPPPLSGSVYSLRFYQAGNATANFSDNAWMFVHPDGSGNQAWSQGIKIYAATQNLDYSFDGTNVHGTVAAGTTFYYYNRCEGGISVKSTVATAFLVEAW